MSEHPTKPGSTWYQDADVLLAELKSVRAAPAQGPEVPGYEVLREIKRGGQGIVYEAVQQSTRRRVAVKVLLDSAYYSSTGKARFEREVDAAAALRHPGIVRVYDSGVTQDRRAYLVMEYAEGQALDHWAESHGREARRTLDLFVKVCDAVQHAHMRGVIHRDLKPSNIRVGQDGTPRVLDFGLAKFAEADGSASGSTQVGAARSDDTLTTTGQFLGSLPWASPEQAQGSHDGLDTRTDVYSLGVVLYYLLTGKFPYDITGPLHTALTNIVSTAPTPARKLRAGIDEQVEVILAKALEKDPAQRYQSAADLSDDIRHHLAGEPIRARRESTWRALQRTGKRYRLVMIVGACALLLVSAAGVGAVMSGRNAARQRDQARTETARARATVEFLQTLLSSASPEKGGDGVSTKVVDVLAKAGATIDETYSKDRVTLGTLHDLLGRVYTQIDDKGGARRHLEAALDVRSSLPRTRENELALLDTRGSIASLAVAEAKYADAVPLLRGVAEDRVRLQGPQNRELIGTYSDLGFALRRSEDFPGSREAFTLAEQAASPADTESDVYLTMLNNKAQLLTNLNEFGEAEHLMRHVIDVRERTSPDTSQALMARSNLAFFLLELGRHDEALREMQPLRDRALRIYGADHYSYLIVLNNLATAHHRLGRNEEAVRLLREALDAYRRRGPLTSSAVAPLGNLSGALADLERHDESADAAKEAYDIALHTWGERSQESLIPMNNYAVSLRKAGRLKDAIKTLRRVVELSGPDAGIYPPGHFQHDMFRLSLATTLIMNNQDAEGLPLAIEAYRGLKEKVGEKHYGTIRAAGVLVKYYDDHGNIVEADKYRAASTMK